MPILTQKYVDENIVEIIRYMSAFHPEKNSQNWMKAISKPDGYEGITYRGYCEGYFEKQMRDRYVQRIDNYCEKEYLQDEREKNFAEKEERLNEQSEQWREITQVLRAELRELKGPSEYDRFIADKLPSVGPYFGL
tara:strand:- start:433 stop:840 length:408 start_codon:yes stop_codon:yes gene_type:complete